MRLCRATAEEVPKSSLAFAHSFTGSDREVSCYPPNSKKAFAQHITLRQRKQLFDHRSDRQDFMRTDQFFKQIKN